MNEEILNIVNETLKIVKNIPEKFQQPAFQEIFRYLLNSNNMYRSEKPDLVEKPEDTFPINRDLDPNIEPYLIKAADLKPQVLWAILQLYSNEKEGTVQSILAFLKEDLGVSEPNRTTVSNYLRDFTPEFVTRERVEGSKAFAYKPTKKIDRGIREFLEEDE